MDWLGTVAKGALRGSPKITVGEAWASKPLVVSGGPWVSLMFMSAPPYLICNSNIYVNWKLLNLKKVVTSYNLSCQCLESLFISFACLRFRACQLTACLTRWLPPLARNDKCAVLSVQFISLLLPFEASQSIIRKSSWQVSILVCFCMSQSIFNPIIRVTE